ncbi:hypothetical protein BH11PSE12_BH11PSE12_23040 [soil metagenome]
MKSADLIRLFALSAIWGASFLFMRIIAPVLGVLPTAFFRVFFAAAGLVAILLAMRVDWNFKGKMGAVFMLGIINSALHFCHVQCCRSGTARRLLIYIERDSTADGRTYRGIVFF